VSGFAMGKKKMKLKIPRRMRKKYQERKRVKKAIDESRNELLRRVSQRSDSSERKLQVAPPQKEKMSDIIIEFAQPLLDAATGPEMQKKAISVAIIAWNLALVPEESQLDQIHKIMKTVNPSNNSDHSLDEGIEIFKNLIARKKSFFPEVHRMIIDYELIETPKGFHLNVVSNILKSEAASKE
jgi:hypothetical protein